MKKKTAAQQSPQPAPSSTANAPCICDGVSLASLAEDHGTPLYVYSATQISQRFQLFQQAFPALSGTPARPHTVCYAVKANSSLAILRLLAEQGAGFDIVSGGELERVRKAHKPALKKVVFSGVGKQAWEIDAALKADILQFNVESEQELDLLAARAQALGIRARFALRVNPDVFAETHPYISTGLCEHKFGIDIKAARAIYRRAAKSKWLEPYGVSVHIGSQIRKVDPFAAALERVTALVAQLRLDGHDIRTIDAGGGLGIDYIRRPLRRRSSGRALRCRPQQRTRRRKGSSPPRARPLPRRPGRSPPHPRPRRQKERLEDLHHHRRRNERPHPPRALPRAPRDRSRPPAHRQATITADIVGPVCESGDFFARDRAIANVKPGDLVALLDAGAYGMTQASNYNSRPRPAEVLIEGTKATLARRRETMRDLLAPEILS